MYGLEMKSVIGDSESPGWLSGSVTLVCKIYESLSADSFLSLDSFLNYYFRGDDVFLAEL